VALHDVARRSFVNVHEVEVVEVLDPVIAVNLEPQGEIVGVLLARARLEHRFARSWGDADYRICHVLHLRFFVWLAPAPFPSFDAT
jgi:hypothetical protein